MPPTGCRLTVQPSIQLAQDMRDGRDHNASAGTAISHLSEPRQDAPIVHVHGDWIRVAPRATKTVQCAGNSHHDIALCPRFFKHHVTNARTLARVGGVAAAERPVCARVLVTERRSNTWQLQLVHRVRV